MQLDADDAVSVIFVFWKFTGRYNLSMNLVQLQILFKILLDK